MKGHAPNSLPLRCPDGQDPDFSALRSFNLPTSPCLSPTGAESMNVWVEESKEDGQSHIHLALRDPTIPISKDINTNMTEDNSNKMIEFPLVLANSTHDSSNPTLLDASAFPSSALVPFQKLRLDTNLNETKLPTSSPTTSFARNRIGISGSISSQLVDSVGPSTLYDPTFAAVSNQQPQLSVRLRGSRVELASPTDDESVDFLGPADDIKKLFKLPYSNAQVSLAVHRVGNTLVVDGDLDHTELPVGFDELNPQETMQIRMQSHPELAEAEQRNLLLYEKFIYESTSHVEPDIEQASRDISGITKKNTKKNEESKQLILNKQANVTPVKRDGPLLFNQDHIEKQPSLWKPHSHDTNPYNSFSPSLGSFPSFQRMLQWKFDDLNLLLGSQVLLFSNAEHPAVSLKLHDMDQELSLVTVLDYYLDNVIENVPELAICMHSQGIVRGYKLLQTREIPYMLGNTARPLFNVAELSVNASMMLKFLKDNCTRENGTYWLYRREGDASLRLYDIDVLSQGKQLKWKYMMAMLCYRFANRASRLMLSLENSKRLCCQLQKRQRELLCMCLNLLDEIIAIGGQQHNSIRSSVAEQLADTYLQEYGDLNTSGKDNLELLEKAKNVMEESVASFVQVTEQSDQHSDISDKDEETEDCEIRDFMGEELLRLQLKCASISLALARAYVHIECENPATWSRSTIYLSCAIAYLPYKCIPETVKNITTQEGLETVLKSIDFDGYQKNIHLAKGRNVESARLCITGVELRAAILEVIGDFFGQLSLNPESATVLQNLHKMYADVSGDKTNTLYHKNFQSLRTFQLHELAFFSYLRALSPSVHSEFYFLLMKKLGNAANEVGKCLLQQSGDLSSFNQYDLVFVWFQRSYRLFLDIEDMVNAALLCVNLAHVHKLMCRQLQVTSSKQHYEAAIQLCYTALGHLRIAKTEEVLQQQVKSELAKTYLMWGVELGSKSDIDGSEVKKKLDMALKLYVEIGDKKQIAATHYQIGSFHSRLMTRMISNVNEFPDSNTMAKLKVGMEIARRQYEKALEYFGLAQNIDQTFILIHEELADLYVLSGRTEAMEHALILLLNTSVAFKKKCHSIDTSDNFATMGEEVMEKLQRLLHKLLKSYTKSSQEQTLSKSMEKKMKICKKMYREVIYFMSKENDSAGKTSNEVIMRVIRILETLQSID